MVFKVTNIGIDNLRAKSKLFNNSFTLKKYKMKSISKLINWPNECYKMKKLSFGLSGQLLF